MKIFLKRLLFICLSCGAAACVEEVDMNMPSYEAEGVAFSIEDFIPETGTKSAFEASTMKFQWSPSDAIGIFPGEGWQTEFKMEAGAGSNTAVFDGGHWGLKTEDIYYAYYPFSSENFKSEESRERVKYSYEGQNVCFAGANGVVDLSGYDFMASGASRFSGKSVNFNFRHLGALCRIRFKAPESASYSNIIIEADEAVFSMSGHYDATDKDGDGVISLVGSSEKISKFVVSFPDGHNTFAAGETVDCYFLMPPSDLGGRNLTFRLQSPEASEYSASITSKNLESGRSYGWNIELSSSPDRYNLSGNGTANCYIVSGPGNYRFKAVRGNGDISVGAVNSVEVLWESFGKSKAPNSGDLISDVSYSDGYITFKASEKKGNAIIAAKDEAGNIRWSWHIWMTDKPEDQVYCNNAGTMMDRNLGATSATPGDEEALGLFYQWGRKDPFVGKALSTINVPSSVESDVFKCTLLYAIAHPTVFMEWLYKDSSTDDNIGWQPVKTIYDPCPPGYRVPDGGDNGVWATAFGTNKDFEVDCYYGNNYYSGFDFGSGAANKLTGISSICWYPAAGYLYNGSLTSVSDYALYWSCSSNGSNAYSFTFTDYKKVFLSGWSDYTRGGTVRCLRDDSVPENLPKPFPSAVDLSTDGTANSYIVSEAGAYKFPTVQGNSATSVGAVAAGEVLWETFGTDENPVVGELVSEVSYSDGYIAFKASDKKGNASIAAKDSDGNILWSWHIWMTDKPKDHVYNNKAGIMIDRNLGAISAVPGDVGALGLMYQWGRKDPFMGGSFLSYLDLSNQAKAKSTPDSWTTVSASASTGTIAYATSHPTTFITDDDSNDGWHYIGDETNADPLWQSMKTIYDPCPPGYRVPDGGEYDGIWSIAFGTHTYFGDDGSFDTVHRGFDFGRTHKRLTKESACWYPSAGYLINSDGLLYGVGSSGNCWSCDYYRHGVYYALSTYYYGIQYIHGFSDNQVDPGGFLNQAYGCSVRCQRQY